MTDLNNQAPSVPDDDLPLAAKAPKLPDPPSVSAPTTVITESDPVSVIPGPSEGPEPGSSARSAETTPVSSELPASPSEFTLPEDGVSFFQKPSSLDLPPLPTIAPGYNEPAPTPQPQAAPGPVGPQPQYTTYQAPDPNTYVPPIPPQPNYAAQQLQPVPQSFAQDSLTWGSGAHWGTLLADIFFPVIGSILVPALIMGSKGTDPFVRENARQALNFSITMSLALILAVILCVVVIGVPFLLAIPIVVLIFRIQGALAAGRGQTYKYPLNIQFVK